jgi:hypothetical protein
MALIPLAVVWVCKELLKGTVPTIVSDVILFQLLAITLLWLLSHRLTGQNRVVSLGAAVLVTCVPWACTFLSQLPHEAGSGRHTAAVTGLIGVVSIPLALAGAAALCRKGHAAGRFRLLFFLFLLPLLGLLMGAAGAVFPCTVQIGSLASGRLVLLGLRVGAFACVCSVFHVVLLSTNRLYRERVQGILRLRGVEAKVSESG